MIYTVCVPATRPRLTERLSNFVGEFGAKRASRRDHVHARRTALAMSEEARINAQMRYRRLRYRHMAS